MGFNTGNGPDFFRRIVPHRLLQFLETFGLRPDIGLIVPMVFQDEVHHAVEQGHVASQAMGHGHIRESGELNMPGIGHDQRGPPFFCPEDVPGNQGMARRGVAADHKDADGVFDFFDGIGHGSASECCGKTCHSGGVSESGAVVHVIGAYGRTGKFLGQVIFLVGHFCRDQDPDAVRAVLFHDLFQALGCKSDRLVPGCGPKPAVYFDKRRFETHEARDVLMKIPALDAQFAPAYGMGLQGQGPDKVSIHDLEQDAASHTAVGAD